MSVAIEVTEVVTAEGLFAYADLNAITVKAAASKLDCTDAITVKAAQKLERDYAAELRERVERYNARHNGSPVVLPVDEDKPVDTKDGGKKTKKASKKDKAVARVLIFGFAATAVIRYMGKAGWTFEDAATALNTLGAGKLADVTIRLQLTAGKKGERGEPAQLSKAQVKQLKAASK